MIRAIVPVVGALVAFGTHPVWAVDAGAFAADAGVAGEDALDDGGSDVDGGVGDVGPAPSLPTVAEAPRPASVIFRGRIVARGNQEPQFGALVYEGPVMVAAADDQGRFELGLTVGEHRLQLQHPGFALLEVLVTVRPGAASPTPVETLRLEPVQSGTRLETVITAPDPQGAKTTLREEELRRAPGSFGDPLRVVESLPGVSQVVWPLAVYAVRGANPGNTGFFVDGVRMPALYHFALGPSVIHPFFIEQLDFYPGGYPVRFGRYVSGIVHARTATPQIDRTHVSADLRLFDAGGITVTPVNNGRGSVAVAGRLSYAGLIFSALSPDFTFSYWDYQLRFEHKLGPGRLTLFAFGSGDHLGRKEQTNTRADLSFHRLSLRWSAALGPGRLEAGGQVGYDSSSTFIDQIIALPISVKTLNAAAHAGYAWAVVGDMNLELGFDGEAQRLNPESELRLPEEQDVLRDRSALMGGAYAAMVFRDPRYELSLGTRYDVFSEQDVVKGAFGPRVMGRVRLNDRFSVKGNVGQYFQMPSLPIAVPGFENFGLATFGLQSSRQGSLGVEAALWDAADLGVTGFLQDLEVTDLASIFNYDPNFQILEMRAGQSYGMELMLRRPMRHKFYGWIAYTLSKSERAILANLLRPAPSDWDQRHILNVVGSYRLGGGYQVGARVHYNSGRPYPVFNQSTLEPGNRDQRPVDYANLPDFFQLDLRFDKRWVMERYVMDVYIELVNSTLSEQVYDLKRLSDGSLDRRGYRIVLPSIGVHVEW
jgi:hypothetical protein